MSTAPNARVRRVRRLAASITLAAVLIGVDSAVVAGGRAAPAAAPSPSAEGVIGLKYGSYGEPVRVLQRALIRVGVGVKYGVDGHFGSATRASVKAFQAYKRLPVTGVVDRATAQALGLVSAPAPSTSAGSSSGGTLARGAVGERVRQLQRSLINAGIRVPGGADGVFGPGTESAVKAYQRSRGLVASGRADAATLSALESGRARDRSRRARPRGDRQRRAVAATGARQRRHPGGRRGRRGLRAGDGGGGEVVPTLPGPPRHRARRRRHVERARPRGPGCVIPQPRLPIVQRARPRGAWCGRPAPPARARCTPASSLPAARTASSARRPRRR